MQCLTPDTLAYVIENFTSLETQLALLAVNHTWRQLVLTHTSHVVGLLRLFCRQGALDAIQTLVKLHYGVIPWHAQNHIALRLSSRYGHTHIVRWLVEQVGLDPSVCDNDAFVKACQNGHVAMVEFLWRDVRVRALMSHVQRGLDQAARHGYIDIVEFLLAQPGVQPEARCHSVFREAALGGHVHVLECLLRDGRVNPAVMDHIALKQACYDGYERVVQLLLKTPRIHPGGWPIITAAQRGHTAIVARLLRDPRVLPSTHANLAVRLAAEAGHKDIVKLLLADARITPGVWLQDAMQKARRNKHYRVLARLAAWSPAIQPVSSQF